MADVRVSASAEGVKVDVQITLTDQQRAQRRYGKRLGDGLIDASGTSEGATVFGDQPLLDTARYKAGPKRRRKARP